MAAASMYWGSMYRIKRLALILLAFALVASAAFAGSETKTYLIGLKEGTNPAIAAQYGAITYQFNAINVIAAQLTPEAAALLAQELGVNFVEENKEQIMAGEDAPPEIPAKSSGIGVTSYTPGSQWNLTWQGINAESAWQNFNVDGGGIKIAFVGTGVNYTLPDLAGQYLGGADFGDNDPDPMPTSNSGTQRASVALGEGTAVKGVASGAGYYAVKIFPDGSSTTNYLKEVAGINWAIEQQSDIVLLDWWETGLSLSVQQAIDNGYSGGILFVGRAGDAADQWYPAKYGKIISVGSHKQDQALLETTQPYNVSVVAPGKDILVLNKDGSTATDDGSDIAAASVVGALALMADFNRRRSLDYNNSSLWAVLNYSAVDWAGAAAGSGKADVNAALAWMDRNWFIDKNALYWNPNSSNNGAPVYYYGSAFDYDVNLANFSDEAFYNLAVTAKAVYLEGAKKGLVVAEIPVFQASVSQLNSGQSVAVGPVPVALAATIEPGLKGVLVELGVGKQGVSPGVVMAFSVLPRGWILAASSPEGIVHLYSIPWYEKEQPYYSGAAAAKMILNYIRSDVNASNNNVTQNEVYNYGLVYKNPANSGTQELDAKAMDAVLGHFDPYDSIVSDCFDSYDSRYYGNRFQGYNYDVHAYDSSQLNEYMKDLVHWMAWPVPQHTWQTKPYTLVAHPNTPAAIPLYGSYGHWAVLNGFAVSGAPLTDPQNDPQALNDFTIFGFWMKDPTVGGLGQEAYISSDFGDYFMPLNSNDQYNGKLVQIAEPPALMEGQMPGEEMEKAGNAVAEADNPLPGFANMEFVGAEAEKMPEAKSAGFWAMALPLASGTEWLWIKKQPWKDMVDEYFFRNQTAVAAFEGTIKGKAIKVNASGGVDDYYLVPFEKRGKATGVIMLDAEDCHFRQATWAIEPENYLPVSEQDAISAAWEQAQLEARGCVSKAEKQLEECKTECGKPGAEQTEKCGLECANGCLKDAEGCNATAEPKQAELAWEPNAYSQTPFKPWWAVTANCGAWVVTQEGKVYKA